MNVLRAILVSMIVAAGLCVSDAQVTAQPPPSPPKAADVAALKGLVESQTCDTEKLTARLDELGETHRAAIESTKANAESSARSAQFVMWFVAVLAAVLGILGWRSLRDLGDLREQIRKQVDQASDSAKRAVDSHKTTAECATGAQHLLGEMEALAKKMRERVAGIEAYYKQDAEEQARKLASVWVKDATPEEKARIEDLGQRLGLVEAFGMPLSAEAWLATGNAHFARGEAEQGDNRRLAFERAVEAYDRAIEMKSDFAQAHIGKGVVLAERGQHQEALACYDRAIQLKPDDAKAHNNKGVALIRLGRYQDALGSCDRAIQLKPDDAKAHNNKGVALANLGKDDEALVSFERAIQIKPDDAEAHHNKGLALAKVGRHEEALACFERAIQIKPDDAEAHCNKGTALGKIGRYEEALACYQRAMEINPDLFLAHYNRACAYARLKKRNEALSALAKAISLDAKFKDMAKTDPDFESLRDDPEFRKMVGLE